MPKSVEEPRKMSKAARYEASVRALARVQLIVKHPRLAGQALDALMTEEVLNEARRAFDEAPFKLERDE